jgi:arylsulfatase A-like enzyme
VFADQMRGMDMGCAGNPDVHTPTMDALAGDGLRLTSCTATVPVCGPNRATLLTGLYPTTHDVLGNDFPLPATLPSLGTIAQENGYRTGYIGKWHLDGVPRSKFTPRGPRRHGFDFWAAYNCTHDYFHSKYYRDTPDLIEVPGYEPEVQTDLAVDFLDHCADGEPFCLVLSWGPPHNPYDHVPERYRALYDPDSLSLRPNVQSGADNPLARGADCRRTIANYYAAITALDDQLARLLATLDARSLAENTVVIFTSDHGDMLWSHGWMRKQAPYEESINVPFLLRWPGNVPPGRVSEALVGTVDLLPTLIGLLGWEAQATFEGEDLSRVLLEQGGHMPDSLFIANSLSLNEARQQNMPEWRGVRTRRHTYVELPGRRPWLLFDNQEDPYQMRNLVDQPEHSELRRRLASTLSEWLNRTGDPFLPGEEMVRAMGVYEVYAERARLMGTTTAPAQM